MDAIKLVVADLVVAFIWVVSEALVKAATSDGIGEVIKSVLMVALLFIFVWIGELIDDAAYNPITELSHAFAGISDHSVFTVVLLISAQVLGSLAGVMCVNHVMPRGGAGPRLKVGLEGGMITEGLLTFTYVLIVLFVRTRGPRSFFLRTWILSISKLSLLILGADYTGPSMNPATAFGWAYARGQHRTKEHMYKYWLAPLEATLLAV